MLRKIRVVLGVVCFLLITLLLLDFTGTLHRYLWWLTRIQFLPAVLALNVVIIAALALLTLVFGRIYCSVICPLGVWQDFVSWLHGRRKKNRFSYSPAKSWLRYIVLGIFVLAIVLGVGVIVALLAPYGTYGRMVNNLFQPLYLWANNGLAAIAERYESYRFYHVDVWIKSVPVFVVTLAMAALVTVLAWRGGRTYCNTICPVGTALSFLARFSWLKVRFDAEKCRSCSLCSKNCKASCIDYKTHTVDYSRCVVCGDCLEKCNFGALRYGRKSGKVAVAEVAKAPEDSAKPSSAPTEKEVNAMRRAVIVGGAIVGAEVALAQANKKIDGGLALLKDREAPKRATALTPPGSLSARNMERRCVGCQLCVTACPNGVLRPSSELGNFMQPVMSYERGYCRPECNRCSQVCPAGAIQPIEPEAKAAIQIGHAVWHADACVALTDVDDKGNHVVCGNCARHCPTGAILLVPHALDDGFEAMVPAVNEARCIGCGACEYVCPARPVAAIYVEGNEEHHEI